MEKAIEEFFKSRTEIDDRYVASRYRKNDRMKYDIEYIGQYLKQDSKVLDLGCGTGLIEDEICDRVSCIVAVDKFAGFLDKAVPHTNVVYKQSDVEDYTDTQKYDVILMYGVSIYLSDEEMDIVLNNARKMLAEDGVLIIKNQWGLNGDVKVDKYSQQLESNYYAIYRDVNAFQALLEVHGFSAEKADIYTKEMNLWDNTHEYAFACKKA